MAINLTCSGFLVTCLFAKTLEKDPLIFVADYLSTKCN